ncbi:vesicle-trafficking protein SEC22a-like [Macrosteles quadrilineatus]|uniref:vesicle-trafficking protein SEC22a-like n=1 Tax=Macrosteles quadrilineatus TaxID=74068 RepID=UPI0023E1A3B6|nr:vesicle-trafficking protein SEC22a-like [Macrosteles quadrilineatus]XP_054269337.1 vesicle-trafficking protein SEC22a-like [Macrosteles quadrilineatus]
MIIYALIVRTKDGMALSATTDFNDEVNKSIKESKRYVKLLAKKASTLPDRCTLYLSLHSVHFISALGVTYLALCDSSYPTVLAFSFLSELMRDFITKYETVRINMARRPYSFIEFDNFIHKTRQRYNKPQSLTTRVNLAELSEEMKLRAPHLLNIADIEPVKNGYRSYNIPQPAVGPPPRLEPLSWFATFVVSQACILSALGIYRSLKALSESSLEEYDGPSPFHGFIFLLESCLRIFQVFLILQQSRYRLPLSWTSLALLAVCAWLVWELRDEWQCSVFLASAVLCHVAVSRRRIRIKLPDYNV